MQIAILSNPIQVGDYHDLFPNTSFTMSGPDDEFLAQNNAKKVTLFKDYDSLTQKLVSCDPYDDGKFVSVVRVEALTTKELQTIKDIAMLKIRAKRNQLLRDCDWTQISDCTVAKKTDWATYRQTLRDLPNTITEPRTFNNWPHDPDWVNSTI
jgi:hypothetical protein